MCLEALVRVLTNALPNGRFRCLLLAYPLIPQDFSAGTMLPSLLDTLAFGVA